MRKIHPELLQFLQIGGCLTGGYLLHLVTGCGFKDIDIFFRTAGELDEGTRIKTNLPVDIRLITNKPAFGTFDISITQVSLSKDGICYSKAFEDSMRTGIIRLLFDNIDQPIKTLERIKKYEGRGFKFDMQEKRRLQEMG